MLCLPVECVLTREFGFQVDRGGNPVHRFQQTFELAQPAFPLILYSTVRGSEVNDLCLIGPTENVISRD